MRNMRKAAAVLLATGMVFALTACGGNKKVENTVNSIDDLEGKSIGVQLGTTGDIYASDYEGDKAGTKIERYNKGTSPFLQTWHCTSPPIAHARTPMFQRNPNR